MVVISKAGRNTQLVADIIAVDICAWVCLRIAQLLRFLQNILKGCMVALHVIQNIIAGTIENTVNAVNLIDSHRLCQSFNPGNSTSGACFIVNADIVLSCDICELLQISCDYRFVGCNDMLAAFQCLQNIRVGRLKITHRFHDDIHRSIL